MGVRTSSAARTRTARSSPRSRRPCSVRATTPRVLEGVPSRGGVSRRVSRGGVSRSPPLATRSHQCPSISSRRLRSSRWGAVRTGSRRRRPPQAVPAAAASMGRSSLSAAGFGSNHQWALRARAPYHSTAPHPPSHSISHSKASRAPPACSTQAKKGKKKPREPTRPIWPMCHTPYVDTPYATPHVSTPHMTTPHPFPYMI